MHGNTSTVTAPKTVSSSRAAVESLVQPYLFFDGRCEEALTFYRQNLGAEILMLMRFKDSPEPQDPAACAPAPNSGEKVMHSSFRVGSSIVMASDGQCLGHPRFEGVALSLTVSNEAEADRVFNALSVGGQVQMPLAKTFFSARFGMVADKFGVTWMILVAK